MSEDKEQKYLGNAKLSQKPERKLVLRLGKGVVKEDNIEDRAVTAEKLDASVVTDLIEPAINEIIAALNEKVDSIIITQGGTPLEGSLGNSTTSAIHQKYLTEVIEGIRRRLDSIQNKVIPIQYWDDIAPNHPFTGYWYDPQNKELKKETSVTVSGSVQTIYDWEIIPMDPSAAYVRLDNQTWYLCKRLPLPLGGTYDALYPFSSNVLNIMDLDLYKTKEYAEQNIGLYVVEDGERNVGTLTIITDSKEKTLTQIFVTRCAPTDGEFFSSEYAENEEIELVYTEQPKTYFRTYGLKNNDIVTVAQWTPWQELSAHIDVDDALDPTHTSENPVMNKVLTAKFEEVQEILDGETKIRYFDAYDETSGVVYSDINYTGSEGSIVYMVSDNKFALRDGTNYYLNWTVNGTRDGNQTEYNKDGKAREDRNFILLTNDNTFSTTLDDRLSLNSDHAVRNSVITTAINKITPLIIEYYTPTTQGDGTITATIRERYSYIKDSYFKGKSIFIRRSLNYQDANISGTIDNSSPAYWVTQFTIDNNDEAALVCYAIGEDGQYRMKIPKNIINGVEQPTSISITKVEGNQSSSINGSSIILFNDLEDRNLPVANTDGSIWYYYSKEDLLEGVFRLSRKKNRDTQTLEEVTPNEGIIYVDVNKKLFYRWANNKFESIGGGGNSVDFDSRISALENLLGLYYTEENGNKVYNLRNIQNLSSELANISSVIGSNSTDDETYTDTEGENHLTVTARLVGLENNKYNYLTEHQDLSSYATKEEVTTALNTKADKGHKVVILAYYKTERPSVFGNTNDANNPAITLYNSMPNGIYWLNPSGPEGASLYKGELVEEGNTQRINWVKDNNGLSEEVLYVTREKNGQQTFIAEKVINPEDNTVYWELTNVPFIQNTPVKVSINVDTNPETARYTQYENGARLRVKEYSTNPEEYADLVVITVNGEEYVPDMLLTAGRYVITYTISSGTGYIGSSVSYTLEVEQSSEQREAFNYSTGNSGAFGTPVMKPEQIEVNALLSEVNNAVTPIGMVFDPSAEVGTPHIYTASEAGLKSTLIKPGKTYSLAEILDDADDTLRIELGTYNANALKTAVSDSNCLGIKLDEMYLVWFNYPTSSPGADGYKNTCVNLPRDFVIDGEVTGQAVGGFYIMGSGAAFYTEHSLNLRKVHTCKAAEANGYFSYCIYTNGIDEVTGQRHGVDQLIVDGCKFDGYSINTSGQEGERFISDQTNKRYIKVISDDENPFEIVGGVVTDYLVKNNCINNIIIKDCYSNGGELLSNLSYNPNAIPDYKSGNCGRVNDTFCIARNTIENVTSNAINWSTANINTVINNVVTPTGWVYPSIMSYASCPLYLVGNTISGVNAVCRTSDYYYAAATIELASMYFLHNEVKNFITSTRDGGTQIYTYDLYFNGKQLYFCNNTVSNVVQLYLAKANTGVLKAKAIGYGGKSLTNLLPTVRYYHSNNILLNPSEVRTIWGNRVLSSYPEVATAEQNLDIDEVMTIKFNYSELSDVTAIRDFVFSNNIVNARWDGTENNKKAVGSYIGNILGYRSSYFWAVSRVEMKNNTFIGTRMSSAEWGYNYDGSFNTGTHLFVFDFSQEWEDNNTHKELFVTDNKFYTVENENIQFYSVRYDWSNDKTLTYDEVFERDFPTNSNTSFSDNYAVQGSTLNTGLYNCSGPKYLTWNVVPGILEPLDNIPEPIDTTTELFDHTTGNLGVVSANNKTAENINISDIDTYKITDIYNECKISKGGVNDYPTSDDILSGDTTYEGSDEPHLWTAKEIGLNLTSANQTTEAKIKIAKSNTKALINAINKSSCIGIKLDAMYYIYNGGYVDDTTSNEYLWHFTNIDSFTSSTMRASGTTNITVTGGVIEIPKDFIIDGGVLTNGVEKPLGGLMLWTGGQGAMFYTKHSLIVRNTWISSSCYYEYDMPYFCIDCREGIDQVQFIDCKFDRDVRDNDTPTNNAAGMYIGFWIDNIDPLDEDGYQIASNYINHIYISGCDVLGNFIGCGPNGYRVLKSCRIINNDIHDIRNIGIDFAPLRLKQRPGMDGSFASKNAYVSCPIWMYENTFSGIEGVKRPVYDIYCGAVIENNILYSLHNTFKNLISAPSVYQHGKADNPNTYSQIRCAATYDQYFTGKQLYYANNTVHNVINLFMTGNHYGCFVAKEVGYCAEDTALSIIRYYKDNNIEICPDDLNTYWNAKQSPTDAFTVLAGRNYSASTEASNLNAVIVKNEEALTFNDWIGIKIDAQYGNADHPIDELTISGNTFNALAKSEGMATVNNTGSSIFGMNNTDSLFAYSAIIENNTFKASRVASEEWGYYFMGDGNYIKGSNSTWLFSVGLVQKSGNSLTLSGNNLYISNSSDAHLCLIKYGQGDAQYITESTVNTLSTSNNNITSGSTLLIGKIDAEIWRTQTKESIAGTLTAE